MEAEEGLGVRHDTEDDSIAGEVKDEEAGIDDTWQSGVVLLRDTLF